MAEILGRQATVTLPSTNDFASGLTLYGHVVSAQMNRPPFDVTRFSDVAERFVLGNYGGRFRIRFSIDSASTAVPRIPSGVVVTVSIAPGVASGSDTYAFKCAVIGVALQAQAVGGSPPQSVEYDFIITPASSDAAATESITYT